MDYKQYGVMGKDILDIQFIANNRVLITYNNGGLIKLDLPVNKLRPKLEMSKLLRSVYPGLSDSEILAKQGTEWKAIARNKKEIKKIDELYEQYLTENNIALDNAGKINPKLAAGLTVVGVAVLITAAVGIKYHLKNRNTDDTQLNNATTIESTADNVEENKLSLENVSYATLVEALKTGKLNGVELNETQRQFLLEAYNFINDNAQKEEWEKVTLTDEELEAVNARLVELGYPPMSGNTAQAGVKYDQVIAAMLRLNKNLTKEDIVAITGGELVEVSDIMDTKSNDFIKFQMERYLYGGFRNANGVDPSHYDVTGLFGFGEHETAAYNELMSLMNAYTTLKNDGNKEAAEAKMVEIKGRLMTILTSPGYDGYFKEYLGETVFVAAIVESQIENYHTQMIITVIDSRTGNEVELTREGEMFNDYETAVVISGLDTFDEAAFMAKYNIDDRYKMVISSVDGSIVNAVCGEQRERLEEINEWIKFLSEDDLAKYKEATIVLKDVVIIMDKGLAEVYPLNEQYYHSFASLYLNRDLVNTNGNTDGNINDVPTAPERPGTATSSIAATNVLEGQNPLGLDPATNAQLQAQAALNAGAITESQFAAYQGSLQSIYEAAYNYYYGQTEFQSAVTFNSEWLNSSDEFIIAVINDAKAQAEARRYGGNGGHTGGNIVETNNGLGQQTNTTAPEASGPGNTYTESVVPGNQGDIDQHMQEVNQAGGNGNGSAGTVPGDTNTIETETLGTDYVNNQDGAPQIGEGAVTTDNRPPQEAQRDSEAEAQALLEEGNEDYFRGAR